MGVLTMRRNLEPSGVVLCGLIALFLVGCSQDAESPGEAPVQAKPLSLTPFAQRPPVTLAEAVAPIPFDEGPYWSKSDEEPAEKFPIPLWWARVFGQDKDGKPLLLITHHKIHNDGFHQLRIYSVHDDRYRPLVEYKVMIGWLEEPHFFQDDDQKFILVTQGCGGSMTYNDYSLLWWQGHEVTDITIEYPFNMRAGLFPGERYTKMDTLIRERGYRFTGQIWMEGNRFGEITFSAPFCKSEEGGTNFPPSGFGSVNGSMRIVRDSRGRPVKLAIAEYRLSYPEPESTD